MTQDESESSSGKGGKSAGSSGKTGSSGKPGNQPGDSSGRSGGSPSGSGARGKDRSSGKSGGSSGNSTTPSGGPSKTEFLKQANTICEKRKRKGLVKMAAYLKQHKGNSGTPNSKLLLEAVKTTVLPSLRTQIDEIRAFRAPQGDESKVEAFLAALEEGIRVASGLSPSSANDFGKSFTRSGKLARDYGLDGCNYG